jgi:hypothetical protein
MLDSTTRAHIQRQLQQLSRLPAEYRSLLDTVPDDEPDLVERTALSAVVQSFYQGAEGVFQTIAKRVDDSMPSSAEWHRHLLRQMAESTDKRPAVISPDLRDQLTPYLAFRHLSRHTYPFLLNWSRMRRLVSNLAEVLQSQEPVRVIALWRGRGIGVGRKARE